MSWRSRAALLATLLSTIALTAQQPAAPSQPTFRAEANYVRVDMYATAGGVPVNDLRQDEIEILDSGIPQRIEQFEHVQIRTGGLQDARVEPNTVRESRAMAEQGRGRVFVIFLDLYHVETGGSHDIRAPLIKALDNLIGPDDLVAVMTPEMSATDIAFARKTTTIEGMLTRYWHWGERERVASPDPKDGDYYLCYPGVEMVCDDGSRDNDSRIAAAMIERRHEKLTLDALDDLVTYLRGVREERKAILAISDGWRLFRPDSTLARRVHCEIPGKPQIAIDPRSGRPTTKTQSGPNAPTQNDCDADRLMLAALDDATAFRRLLDNANRANASFYPIDPRGLVVFDTPLVPVNGPGLGQIAPPVPPSVDQAILTERLTSLRTLADATDGLAIVGSNDLDKGFRRVVDDLTSYYLLGYYTTAKLDGKFHAITVRVKRPGVQVRARRGYLAPTPGELSRAAAAPPIPTPAAAAAAAEKRAFEAVIAPLAAFSRDLPLRVQVATGWLPGSGPAAGVWVTGELGALAAPGDGWAAGFEVTAALTGDAGTVASGTLSVPAGARAFRLRLTPAQPLGAGEYVLRVGARAGAAAIPSRETVHVTIAPPTAPSGVLYVRRGPATGNQERPAADLRFRRSERVRIEWPDATAVAGVEARLLDRTGQPLAVPVAVATREADGTHWTSAEVALAPLAAGDYIVELTIGSEHRLAGFRVVP